MEVVKPYLTLTFSYLTKAYSYVEMEILIYFVVLILVCWVNYKHGISKILIPKNIDSFLLGINSYRDKVQGKRRQMERLKGIAQFQIYMTIIFFLTLSSIYFFVCGEELVCIGISDKYSVSLKDIRNSINISLFIIFVIWMIKCCCEYNCHSHIYKEQELIFEDKLMIENIINQLGYPLASKMKDHFSQEEKKICNRDSCKISKSIEEIDLNRYSLFSTALRNFEWCQGCMIAIEKPPEYCENSCLTRFRQSCTENNKMLKEEMEKMNGLKEKLKKK